MNSNFGNFDFDLGMGSNNRSSKPLNQHKSKSPPSSYSHPNPTPSWQPGKPSWTHQPAPGQPSFTRSELGGPASMVGDITGKSWNSTAPAARTPQTGVAAVGVVGIANKNPNLFGDLVSSAIGKNVATSNAPLKSAAPAKSSFSMAGVADSLPKGTAPGSGYGGGVNDGNSAKNVGGSQSFGGLGSGNGGSNVGGFGGAGVNKGSGLGGSSMRSGGGGGMGMGVNKDPFVSLVDFSSKPMSGGGGAGSKGGSAMSTDDFGFGEFQNAAKPNSNPLGSVPKMNGFGDFQNAAKPNSNPLGSVPKMDGFGDFLNAPQSNSTPLGSVPKMDSFGSGNQASAQSMGVDSFDDMFFTAASASGGTNAVADGGDDWDFGGGHDNGGTTEIEGLPAPPPGVSASSAKSKGLDNYKQGQFADAIKWLSWAEILLGKAGDTAGTMEVLTCKASCYKEVGEYKKAVADCTKILDHDGKNVAALVQRALLYESMEKYRLGAEDLRTVMKLDPGNRVARSTIHRLTKMAD